ncbi:hypothetical protein Hanom_Chr01g00071771 [Helianthus anomalus]
MLIGSDSTMYKTTNYIMKGNGHGGSFTSTTPSSIWITFRMVGLKEGFSCTHQRPTIKKLLSFFTSSKASKSFPTNTSNRFS